ncbi:penicillin-binding protein 2 [Candidatus Gracilibacteria bacterium 28_42_T64]|nr:penicillin-binding protein 2 [Candidatus Gracilibacteria bacterium 28_42_T64]
MKKNKIIQKAKKYFDGCNRIYVIAVFFVLFFLIIIYNLFAYTVLNYSFYNQLADRQQIGEVTVPVTRGTIYSSTNQGTILGTSLNLYNIAIDPKMEGNKDKLQKFLTEVSYKQLCYLNSKKECYKNLLKFLRVLEIEDFRKDELLIKDLISAYLTPKLNQTKVNSVFIDKELDNEEITQIINLGIKGLYPSGQFLYVNPEEIDSDEYASKELSSILGMTEKKIKHLIRKRELRYIPVLNKLSISVSEYIKNYLEEENIALKNGILDRINSIGNFIILTPNPHRYYPEKEVGSQLIGFVDSEGVGHYGIEGYFDDILKGNNGKIVSKKDVLGRIINPIDLKKEDFIGEGIKIHSTIDRNIQKKVETILENGVKRYRANKGTIVVMEPKTGRVLSIANYPTYNLNNYGDVYELEKVRFSKYPDPKVDLLGFPVFVEDKENGDKFYYDSKEILLRRAVREELGENALVKYKYKNDFGPQVYKNDAISSLYEPGSIMKALTVAIGIDTGEINRYSMYMDKGELTIDSFTIKNVSDKCLGYHSFAHALNFSCNVGMIRIVQRIGKVLLHQYFTDFGFNELTGITLEGEVFSQVTPWEKWSRAKLFTSSYGLGVSVTPLQMASSYSTLVNGGIYIKPRIIDYIEFSNNKVIKYKKELERRVIKESTSKIIVSMLVSSAKDGAAKNGNVLGYSVGGKTGTSQIPYKGIYEKGVGSTIASYAGFGPAEDPKFVIIVKLDRPRTNNFGGQTAAFVFNDVASYLFDYYEIPRRVVK